MSSLFIFRAFLLSLVLISLASVASYAQNANTSLRAKLEALNLELQETQRELEVNVSKREETTQKLKQSELELQTKSADLAAIISAMGSTPTTIQSGAIENEQKRLDLAELGLKYLRATELRLANKEDELRTRLKVIESQKLATEQSITRSEIRAKQESEVKIQSSKAELENLRLENERLREVAIEEAERTKRAAEEAKRLKDLQEMTAAEPVTQPSPETKPAPTPAPATEPAATKVTATTTRSSELDLSQIALPDEPPVYTGDDGLKAVIRSRSIDRRVVMEPIGPKLYRARLKVEPGRAFFDVRKRRYRGYFPETATPQIYNFFYDISGEIPVFSVVLDDSIDINSKDNKASGK